MEISRNQGLAVRQETFDTDPRRNTLKKGALELPIIENYPGNLSSNSKGAAVEKTHRKRSDRPGTYRLGEQDYVDSKTTQRSSTPQRNIKRINDSVPPKAPKKDENKSKKIENSSVKGDPAKEPQSDPSSSVNRAKKLAELNSRSENKAKHSQNENVKIDVQNQKPAVDNSKSDNKTKTHREYQHNQEQRNRDLQEEVKSSADRKSKSESKTKGVHTDNFSSENKVKRSKLSENSQNKPESVPTDALKLLKGKREQDKEEKSKNNQTSLAQSPQIKSNTVTTDSLKLLKAKRLKKANESENIVIASQAPSNTYEKEARSASRVTKPHEDTSRETKSDYTQSEKNKSVSENHRSKLDLQTGDTSKHLTGSGIEQNKKDPKHAWVKTPTPEADSFKRGKEHEGQLHFPNGDLKSRNTELRDTSHNRPEETAFTNFERSRRISKPTQDTHIDPNLFLDEQEEKGFQNVRARGLSPTTITIPAGFVPARSPQRQKKQFIDPYELDEKELHRQYFEIMDNEEENHRAVITERKDPYETLYAERQTLLKAEITYRKRIKQLEDEANGFLKSIEDLSSENKLLRSKLDALEHGDDATDIPNKGRIDELESEKHDLQNKIKELQEKTENTQSDDTSTTPTDKSREMRELKAQVIKLQTENQTINEENIKLKAEHLQTVKQLHAFEKEKKSLESSVTAVESEKLSQLQSLQNDHSKLREELKELKEAKQDMKNKVEALEYENNALSESLTQKKTEVDELLAAMKDDGKFDEEIKQLKNQVLKLTKEKQNLESESEEEKKQLVKELDEIRRSLEEKSQYFDEMKVKKDEFETEKSKLESENESLKKLTTAQKKEIEDLKKELETLKAELKEERERHEGVKEETDNAKKEVADARAKLEEFHKEFEGVRKEKEEQLTKVINELEAARLEKEAETANLKEDNEKLKTENERLGEFEKHVVGMQAEVKSLAETLEEVQKEKKAKADELTIKSEALSSAEQRSFEMNVKNENMTQRVNDLEREKRIWEVRNEKYNDLELSNRRLSDENKKLRMALEKKDESSPRKEGMLRVDLKDDKKKDVVVVERKTKETKTTFYGAKRDRNSLDRTDKDSKRKDVDGWLGSTVPKNVVSTHAVYVEHEAEDKGRGGYGSYKQKAAFTKAKVPSKASSQVQPKTKGTKEKISTARSRSVEDVKRVKDVPSPGSSPSLPAIDHEPRLTFGLGYSAIHKNRILAARSKRVF